MSNFKNTQSIFHALILTAAVAATSSLALTASAQDTAQLDSAQLDAFTLADSNGDNGLDRNEFPVFISLKSGNNGTVSLVSDSTSYEIPFTNKDKNADGLLDTKELQMVERDIPAWDAPQESGQATETETETVEEVPVMEAPAVEAPVEDVPVIETPDVIEPEIQEPSIDELADDELTIEPMEEGTPDADEVDPLPEDIDEPEELEPQPKG